MREVFCIGEWDLNQINAKQFKLIQNLSALLQVPVIFPKHFVFDINYIFIFPECVKVHKQHSVDDLIKIVCVGCECIFVIYTL